MDVPLRLLCTRYKSCKQKFYRCNGEGIILYAVGCKLLMLVWKSWNRNEHVYTKPRYIYVGLCWPLRLGQTMSYLGT